jgi:hypothetical protein
LLSDASPNVRRAAVDALGGIHDDRTVEPLVSALKDPDPMVSKSAILALKHAKDPRLIEPFIELLATVSDRDLIGTINETLSNVPDPRVSAATPVCEGSAGSAVDFSPQTTGLHPVVVVTPPFYAKEWYYSLPAAWRPPGVSPSDAQLVACIGDVRMVAIETCPYVDAPSITRYQQAMDVDLRAASTGKIVASTTLFGSYPRYCNAQEVYYLTELVGEWPVPDDLEAWLRQYVE